MAAADPSVEQIFALHRFAAQHGRRWKAALNQAWMTATYDARAKRTGDDALLQQVRNFLGPSWLARFKLPTLHRECTVTRTILITHGSLNLGSGDYLTGGQEWITRACGSPLFDDAHKLSGQCRGCQRGWNHPNNYRADGPRPEQEENA